MGQSVKRATAYPQSLEYLVSLHFNEDYETLRNEAQELKTVGEDAPTRALGAFFYEHASAFLRWFSSYDYEAIRAREEAAKKVLRGQHDCFPSPDSGAVIFALQALSMIVIEGTYIENGVIADDPLPMYEHSKRLKEWLDKAHEGLSQWEDAHPVFIADLEWRRAINNGIYEYTELLAHFPYNKAYFLANVAHVEQHLDTILQQYTNDHPETCSDLRAHKESLRYYRQYLEQAQSTLCFRDTHISWLLNFQIDLHIAAWLCDELTYSFEEDSASDEVQDTNRLLAAEAHEHQLEQLTADAQERFRKIWHDIGREKQEEKQQQKQQGKKKQQGRLPHIENIEAADLDFLETGFGEHDMRACIITFRSVRTQLASLAKVADNSGERDPDEIEMTLKIYAYGICTLEFSVDNLDLDIFQLRQISTLLAPFGPKSFYTWREYAENEHGTGPYSMQLEPLAQLVFEGLRTTARAYIQEKLDPLEELNKRKDHKNLIAAAREQLRELQELRAKAKDEDNWIYAPHLNWYTYANPQQIMLAPLKETTPGEKTAHFSPLGSTDITTLPDFKGLVLPLRERRRSVYDWLAMRTPERNNLALMVSQPDSLFFVVNHWALLYFPNDPSFNVLAYRELLEMAVRLNCLLISLVARAKIQFDELALMEADLSKALQEPGKLGKYHRERQLTLMRSNLATSAKFFDFDALRLLDLLNMRVVSPYGDATKLIQAMTDELEISNLRQLYEEAMGRVNLKRTNLFETMSRLQAYQAEEQTRKLQDGTTILAILLAAAGVDAIITDIQAAFSSPLWSPSWLHLLFVFGFILLLAIFLLIRYVRRADPPPSNGN